MDGSIDKEKNRKTHRRGINPPYFHKNFLIRAFLFVLFLTLCLNGCKKTSADDFTEVELENAVGEKKDTARPDKENQDEGQKADVQKTAVVYVCGAVNQPGVYTLPEGTRIYEAIAAAGGVKPEAAEESLNQADKVTDGERLYVPTDEELKQGIAVNPVVGTNGADEAGQGKVNLNTAQKEELKTLPGIGDAKADSIISYRQTNGGFKSIEELMQIEGIKEGVFRKIEDKVTI